MQVSVIKIKRRRRLTIEDLANRTFGKLTVIERDYTKINGKTEYYKCNCDCGTKDFIATAKELLGGKGSCGCIKKVKSFNEYKIIDDYVIIYFKRKKDGIELEGYIDLEDLQKFVDKDMPYCATWMPNIKNYYAKASEYIKTTNGKSKCNIHHMHHDIMGNIKGMKVDHINHNTLDNRKANLRVIEATNNSTNRNSRNKNNTSGYRNVFWSTGDNKWLVALQVEGKQRYFGRFDYEDVDKAGERAEEMRKKYYKEYAGNN